MLRTVSGVTVLTGKAISKINVISLRTLLVSLNYDAVSKFEHVLQVRPLGRRQDLCSPT
jgi:hypothetical protein